MPTGGGTGGSPGGGMAGWTRANSQTGAVDSGGRRLLASDSVANADGRKGEVAYADDNTNHADVRWSNGEITHEASTGLRSV